MTSLSKTWFNNAWIREQLNLPKQRTKVSGDLHLEVAALKAERDRLGSYNSHLIADREILFAENTRLRAALEAVLPIAEAFRGRVDMEPKLQIARRALEAK